MLCEKEIKEVKRSRDTSKCKLCNKIFKLSSLGTLEIKWERFDKCQRCIDVALYPKRNWIHDR